MFTFCICLCVLAFGFCFYTRRLERLFGADDRVTPVRSHPDGVDYKELPRWKIFLIQFLNIAGLGPIFGAVAGALWGPVVMVWITLGTIFVGSVHDYFSGMLSLRNNGATMGEIIGIYLGKKALIVSRVLTIGTLVLVGAVFTVGPAGLIVVLLKNQAPGIAWLHSIPFWSIVIFLYYFLAVHLPIDKLIGRLYPIFGICLLVMAVGVLFGLFCNYLGDMPELFEYGVNMHPKGLSIVPFLFVTVACGAVSGFHATQSPAMARCLGIEKDGRGVFAGAMYAEGMIALIWAAAGCALFPLTEGTTGGLLAALANGQAPVIYDICIRTMGPVAAVLAFVGVIVCPITSGDTAFRAARMGIIDWIGGPAKVGKKGHLAVCFGVIAAGALISMLDYSVLWRYFAWFNQTIAACMLWVASVFMVRRGSSHWIVTLPACFMTVVCTSYFLLAPECLGHVIAVPSWLGVGCGVAVALFFLWVLLKHRSDAPAS